MARRLYVATRKGIFFVDRTSIGAGRWEITGTAFLGDNCSSILADPRNGTLYAALGHGHFGVKLHRSHDEGSTWDEIATPVYLQARDDEQSWVDAFGRTVPNSLELIWTLEAGATNEPGALWCGTVPGALFRSTDSGDSWSMVRGLWDHPLRRKWVGGGMDYPGIHSICVHPVNSGHLLLAVSCGGVWETLDGGQRWECIGEGWRAEYMPPEQASDRSIQDPHRLVQCRAQPDHLWVQHHNGIFRSVDGGRNWHELTAVQPSAFGFAVAVHPSDANTAWFVPAIKDEQRIPVDGRLVVTRTRDGGETFERLTDGLPQTHAYDLVYRHGLDVDSGGDNLAIGSTTGSLWMSEDQGEHWEHVAAHLPPIHGVRFAN